MSEEREYAMLENPVPNIAHPYLEGLIVVGMLCGLFTIVTAVAGALALAGVLMPSWVLVTGIFLAFWGLILLTIWVWGMIKLWQMRNFLGSTRPIIRWWYTPEEWSAIQEEQEREQLEDLMVAPGCLAVLFAIVGVLVGGMIGADEGVAEAVVGGGAGLLIG